MKLQTVAALSLALCALVPAAPAKAAPVDALGQCLNAKASDADRVVLVRWIFAGMARSEATRDMANLTEEQRVAAVRKAGLLLERLLTVDCRAETIAEMKADPDALEKSFGTLGERAMEDLLRDPHVAATFAGIIQYIDMNKFASVLVESGSFGRPAKK